MIKFYEEVNPNKLVDELQKANLIEGLSFFPKVDGLEVGFRDIKEVSTDVLDEDGNVLETVISYTKRSTKEVIKIIDEVEVTKTVEVWNDFDPTQLLADIQAVVDAHDPTPYEMPNPNLTIEERIERLELLELQKEGAI